MTSLRPGNCCIAKDSFDHLVGCGEKRQRDNDLESLCGLQVDYQVELGRILRRQSRPIVLQDAIYIGGGAAMTTALIVAGSPDSGLLVMTPVLNSDP
jgi:hypothetical protein